MTTAGWLGTHVGEPDPSEGVDTLPLAPVLKLVITLVQAPAETVVSGGVPRARQPVLSPSTLTVQVTPESGTAQLQVPHVAGPPSGFVCPPSCGWTTE